MVELSEMLPSVDLVRVIAELDRAAVNSEERLGAIAACERVLSWMTALQNDLLVDADRDYDPTVFGFDAGSAARWYGEQVGMALGISGSAAQRRMNQAITLTEKRPNVTSALRVGAITVHHARVTAVNVNVLDTEIAQAVDAAVMTDTDWRTPSQLEKAFRQTILALDPAGPAKRNEEAKRGRRTSMRPEPDGMCSYWALLSAEQGQAVDKAVEAHARSSSATNTPGDCRTLDERRADALVDLVTRQPGEGSTSPTSHGQHPQIHITVSWSTVIGLDHAPADLTGYGPIDATTARRIAFQPHSVWRRLLVDPASGRLLDYGHDTYSPPQDLQDFVIVYAASPTSHVSSRSSDTTDTAAAGTSTGRLTGRSHHRLKHEGGWRHDRAPDTDDSIWTDPDGRTHIKPATKLPTPVPVEPPRPSDDDLGDPPF